MQKLLPTSIVTICSNRKRAPVPDELRAASLPAGELDEVAETWAARLRDAPTTAAARQVYGGRAFREADAAASACDGELWVVSAGLGLIKAETAIPAYGLTLSAGQADGVLRKFSGGAAEWWSALTKASPFHRAWDTDDGLILAALPAPYLAMVAADWSDWPDAKLARLRLFSRERPTGAAARLAAAWMPYDDRLEDPKGGRAGTKTDFAQRALRHFVEHVGVAQEPATAHATAVVTALAGLMAPEPPNRPRLDDRSIKALIHEHWETVSGRSSHMLRYLRRELGFACEQRRFKDLFKDVASSRLGATP